MARGGPWAVEGAGVCGVAGRPARSPALAPLRHAPGGCRRHLRTARNRGLRLRSRPGLLTPLSHHVLRLDHGWLALGGADGARPRELRDPTSKGTLARYRRGRDSAWASGPYVPDLRGDPGPLPVRRRGARGRHGGPDLRRVRSSRILRAGQRNGPRTPSLAHRPLAPQGREPRPRASIQSACRDNGSLALRRRTSALQRMYLYQQEFGLTELRLYTTIFMVWISVVLLWFVLTVLCARRDRFAFGAFLAGFAAIFAINVMYPEALIASTNIDRMEDGKRFDAYYLTTLSAGAVPVLGEALPEIGDASLWKDYTVEQAVVDRWDSRQADWRTWNLGRSRARQLVRSHVEEHDVRAFRVISLIPGTKIGRLCTVLTELSTTCCG